MSELHGLRVLVLVQNLPVPFDRRVWQESTTLSRAGADLTVVCPADDRHPEGEYVIDGIRVVRYRNPPEASGPVGYLYEYIVSLWRMRREVVRVRESGPFDIVHFCNPPDLLHRVARVLVRRDRSLLVFDQHDLGPELVKAKRLPFSPLFVGVARHLERATYRAADHVIATNESYKAIAKTRGGFDDKDVTVVRSGPPEAWLDEEFRRADWHNGRRHLIGYLGVMGTQEGIDHLLDAVGILVNRGYDVQASLVGSGPDRDRLERRAIDLGLGDRVRFHGRVSDDEMKSILADADVCVNPDEVNEMNDLSTMNKIIEYMALGRPVVQFDVREGRFSAQGASLYALANDSGSFADRIADVLDDPELAAEMSRFGRQRFRDILSWDRQAAILVELYERLKARLSRGDLSNQAG